MNAGLELPEAVARCVRPSAPEDLRLAVAQGAIPMPPVERLTTLTALIADASESVRQAAQAAWSELPSSFFEDAVSDPRLPEPTLDLIAALAPHDHDLVCRVMEHPRVGARTLKRFLASDDEDLLSRIAQNQRVLDTCRELAQELLENPNLHPSDRGRLASLYAPEEPPEPEPEEEEEVELPVHLPQELFSDQSSVAESDTQNLYQVVQSLTVTEKIKLAMLGGKSARRLLVRDNNKVVATSVIKSPKIGEDEVLAIAQDRTVADEVIRLIFLRKDWLKNYPLRLALSQNPKTPVPRALRLLDTLQDRDLRQISKSRNVPSPVSAGATRILARRGKI